MKIHGICLVKNEADIVRYSLRENARWCDRIYVYDNGSTDGTMERVRELARSCPAVIPFGSTDAPFHDALRSAVFNHYRGEAARGDWWCRLDADEVYVGDPRTLLGTLPGHHQVVWSIYLQYYLTERDLPRLEAQAAGPAPEITAELLPRYYRADYAEPKFFRHRARLRWAGGSWPDHVGVVAPELLRHRHYQYRSPAQIEQRLATRREAASKGWSGFPHADEKSWREKIRSSAELHFDARDHAYVIDEEKLPRHLETAWRRGMKRMLHGIGVWP